MAGVWYRIERIMKGLDGPGLLREATEEDGVDVDAILSSEKYKFWRKRRTPGKQKPYMQIPEFVEYVQEFFAIADTVVGEEAGAAIRNVYLTNFPKDTGAEVSDRELALLNDAAESEMPVEDIISVLLQTDDPELREKIEQTREEFKGWIAETVESQFQASLKKKRTEDALTQSDADVKKESDLEKVLVNTAEFRRKPYLPFDEDDPSRYVQSDEGEMKVRTAETWTGQLFRIMSGFDIDKQNVVRSALTSPEAREAYDSGMTYDSYAMQLAKSRNWHKSSKGIFDAIRPRTKDLMLKKQASIVGRTGIDGEEAEDDASSVEIEMEEVLADPTQFMEMTRKYRISTESSTQYGRGELTFDQWNAEIDTKFVKTYLDSRPNLLAKFKELDRPNRRKKSFDAGRTYDEYLKQEINKNGFFSKVMGPFTTKLHLEMKGRLANLSPDAKSAMMRTRRGFRGRQPRYISGMLPQSPQDKHLAMSGQSIWGTWMPR